ncbi:chromatin-remodeling ATPase Ino80p [[Candida] anglica]|uniref:Chromatin-remodeling ATPase INO80 n=1 Tax=[Candida] anglica TaxID=148631 RepID=A0ABP0ELU1_9ASCO
MNISSMLTDVPTPVSSIETQSQQQQDQEKEQKQPVQPSLSITKAPSSNPITTSSVLDTIQPIPVSDDDELDDDLSLKSQIGQENYLLDFTKRVGILAQLDQYYTKANNFDVLDIERKILEDTTAKTEIVSNNYIERVVTEEISAGGENIHDDNGSKAYQWGTTRITRPKPSENDSQSLLDAVAAAESKGTPRKAKSKASGVVGGSKRSTPVAIAAADSSTDATSKKPVTRAKPKRRAASAASTTTSTTSTDDTTEPSTKRRRRTTEDKSNADGEDKSTEAEGESNNSKPKPSQKEQRVINKQYENTFVAIWKDLSRKDGPKVSRLMQQSTQAKMINLKKTSILAAREAKRWQLKNNKNQKDLTTKARRAMREMFNFWKRNERIERELRKKHEKELIDKAKKEEEDREAKRQARKLNFLITQTELYSHFIGKKIKTDEIEGSDSDPNIRAKASNSHYDKYQDITGEKAADFSTLDFDNEDDEALTHAAAANAQVALQAAQSKAKAFDNAHQDDTNGEEMNFQNPALMGDITIKQPDLLKCTLKEYQIKGLNWLANLYEQGINGILADEMGLGKTVQSISVLSYLAEHHNIWGPFLVVTPASTLHNWQQEISKFVPDFKVLPYWGNAKDRKVLRKFWDRKNVRYGKDAPFHVLVTSYQLVVADAAYFQKMKWQYMILDEAQAIKSSQSSRWKSLLSFSCRNRLLLTGTPIQNSMQELWALLHFIMPSLFDSHDEFSDWFSKDIESHAQSNTQLNEQQLRRLHMILKPFMLRRIKKNVQSELGDKVEIDLFCNLTQRQKKYYQMLKSQISVMDLLDPAGANGDSDSQSLMNLVMQFRKVCNHPDLFERADVRSPFVFGSFAETSSFLRESNDLEASYSLRNSISYPLPRLIFDEILQPSFDNQIGSREKLLNNTLSIYDPENVTKSDAFSFLRFTDTSAQELRDLTRLNVLERAINNQEYSDINYERSSRFKYLYEDEEAQPASKLFLINEYEGNGPSVSNSVYMKELHSVRHNAYESMNINVLKPAAEPLAAAPPIDVTCSQRSFVNTWNLSLFNEKIRSSMAPLPLNTELDLLEKKIPVPNFPKSNMCPPALNKQIDYSNIRMPSMNRFITESGKLAKLDELLSELKKNDHRVLVYFQMTKMMDLMEEYLTYRQHSYIRLDGSSKLDDRRDLVHDWQSKPEIFVFLLSTRAGGLGINLTAADTVVFYDSDWNPTIDSQAMDRAHRLGQTRQVTVYRLLVRGTIEERMRNRAKQKEQVQQVVMEGKAATPSKEENNKKKDVAFLLMDDEESPEIEATTTIEVSTETDAKTGFAVPKGLEEMYHEGEGKFSVNPSGTTTPSLN